MGYARWRTETEALAEIQARVGPLPAAVRAELVQGGWLGDMLELDREVREEGLKDAVAQVRKWKRLGQSFFEGEPPRDEFIDEFIKEPKSRTKGEEPSSYEATIATLLAGEASSEEVVQKFRQEVLGDQWLALDQVEGWVNRMSREKIAPDAIGPIVVAVPTRGDAISQPLPSGSGRNRVLEYAVPGKAEQRWIPTSGSRVLEGLADLADDLADRYPWSPAQATVFVLTGVPPLTPRIRSAFRPPSAPALGATARILLTIDPSASPEEVEASYRSTRRRYTKRRRHRPLERKALLLAQVAATKTPDNTWKELMLEWNREHPEWPYTAEKNFAKDCARDRRRLLNPLGWASVSDALSNVPIEDRADG
jgi:hypothetical protein